LRILAATNKNLEEEVNRGRFREDLFYRLNVVTIPLPPLKERSTDIPQLAEYFVKKDSAEAGRLPMPITTEAMRLLLQYHWPGNVRQLEAVLQRAVLLSDGQKIDYADLPVEVRFSTLPSHESDAAPGPEGTHLFLLPPTGIDLEGVERDFILQAMELSGWVIAKAAKLLGLSYRTLQYRLDKFEIRREGSEGVGTSEEPAGKADPGPRET
jgi:transcriptional regulator with GAF, ATPase, and Fis domain